VLNKKQLDALVGSTIVGYQDATLGDLYEPQLLILRKNDSITIVAILADEEGNGPGHLDVTPQSPEFSRQYIARLL
jgi:hypothetical protein